MIQLNLLKVERHLTVDGFFKKKTKSDGSIERYKARLVATGCSQKFSVDYDITFCPVARLQTDRTVLT